MLIRCAVSTIPTPIESGIKMAFPVYFWYLTPKNKGKAMDIFALFHSFCQVYSATMLRNLSAIIAGALDVGLIPSSSAIAMAQ
jgi:hypothetical protein